MWEMRDPCYFSENLLKAKLLQKFIVSKNFCHCFLKNQHPCVYLMMNSICRNKIVNNYLQSITITPQFSNRKTQPLYIHRSNTIRNIFIIFLNKLQDPTKLRNISLLPILISIISTIQFICYNSDRLPISQPNPFLTPKLVDNKILINKFSVHTFQYEIQISISVWKFRTLWS